MTIHAALEQTDWKMFRRQKHELCEIQNEITNNELPTPEAQERRHELLEGLLNFLDAIQDAAADQFGLDAFPDDWEE